jgi:hypothetical protein
VIDRNLHGSVQPVQRPPRAPVLQRLPRNVVALGVVSLLMGMSSQMTHSLLPLFLVTVLGASTVSVGVIEGIAAATDSIARVFSGTLSDWPGCRRSSGGSCRSRQSSKWRASARHSCC